MRGDARAERFGQRRQEADGVDGNREMREIEDRRVAVGVDGDDEIGAFDADAMLDRAGNAGCDIELRPDRLAGLADLPIRRRPPFCTQRARTAPFAAEHAGERAHQLQVLGALQPEPAGDDDVGEGEVGLLRARSGRKHSTLVTMLFFPEVHRVFDDAAGAALLTRAASP